MTVCVHASQQSADAYRIAAVYPMPCCPVQVALVVGCFPCSTLAGAIFRYPTSVHVLWVLSGCKCFLRSCSQMWFSEMMFPGPICSPARVFRMAPRFPKFAQLSPEFCVTGFAHAFFFPRQFWCFPLPSALQTIAGKARAEIEFGKFN